MPWKLGTGNSEHITNNIDKYLEVFFDKYLKEIQSKKLKRACKNPQASLTKNTLLLTVFVISILSNKALVRLSKGNKIRIAK
jgi:hypothetical protein